MILIKPIGSSCCKTNNLIKKIVSNSCCSMTKIKWAIYTVQDYLQAIIKVLISYLSMKEITFKKL